MLIINNLMGFDHQNGVLDEEDAMRFIRMCFCCALSPAKIRNLSTVPA